jgi:hypothetical protein
LYEQEERLLSKRPLDDAPEEVEEVRDVENTSSADENTTPEEPKKEKSLFEMAKEIEEKERIHEAELERQELEHREKVREDYAKQLQQDKIELIKLKQGAIDHSDTIHEIHEEAPVLTVPQKIYNFFYHNMWWLWIVAFVLLVAGIITYDIVTTPKPDATVLMFTTDDEIGDYYYQYIADYFEQFIEDNNGDGVSTVSVYYIPLNTDSSDKLYTSYMVKFSGEMQSANSMLVLADDSCDDQFKPKETLYDLTDDFGQYEDVDKYKYYLKDSSLQEYLEENGYTGTLPDSLYLGIRKVQQVFDSSEKMQKNFDIAFELFNNLIDYEEEGIMNIG